MAGTRGRKRLLSGLAATLVALLMMSALPGLALANVGLQGSAAAKPAVAAPLPVTVTFYKEICPNYSDVPSNSTPGNLDATRGHSGGLDTTYGTSGHIVGPSTDIPAACAATSGWSFFFTNSGGTATTGGPFITGSDGSVTVTLSDAQLALAQSGTGLWVREDMSDSAGFGSIRCYNDIANGDNLEQMTRIGSTTQLYCIAYNVRQVITFDPLAAKTYGDAPIALSATATSGLPVSLAASGQCSLSGTTLTITGVGSCSVTASQAGRATNPFWSPAIPVIRSFNIAPAVLTVTAHGATRAFGAANPTFTAAITGFVNGETGSVVSGSPAFSTPAVAGSPVGSYDITPAQGTLNAANYAFAFVKGTLTVTPVGQAIDFDPLAGKTYGDAPIELDANASSGLPVSFIAAGQCTVIDGIVTITGVGSCSITASQAGDANWTAAEPVTRQFDIAPAVLTVTANDASRAFGAANPTFTATITGFVNGDNGSVVSGSAILTTTASVTSPVGPYDIAAAKGTLSAANYTFAFVKGTLTVVIAGGQMIAFVPLADKTYGGAPIALHATATSGLPVSFVASGQCTVSDTTVTFTGIGTCSITATQVGDTNWSAAEPVTRTFNIAPALLTVTANDASRAAGAANPTFTATITGFVNGENGSVVSGSASLTTNADATSPVGPYDIAAAKGTLSAANYTFEFVKGTLTVTVATVTPTQEIGGASATPSTSASHSQSLLGVTNAPNATPPATSAARSGSGEGGIPVFALLIALAFGSIAALMVEKQRRTIRN